MTLKLGNLTIRYRPRTKYMKLKDGTRVPLVRIAPYPSMRGDKPLGWFAWSRR